jgi:uncharacterized protein (DUF3084 family)
MFIYGKKILGRTLPVTGHGAAVTGCKQDRQRACDVILKRCRATTGAVENL